MQTLVPKNDNMKNKNRQEHMGIFSFTGEPLAIYLDGVATDNNKVGQYPNPIYIYIYIVRVVRTHSIKTEYAIVNIKLKTIDLLKNHIYSKIEAFRE